MLTRFRRNVKKYFCFQLAYIVPKRPEAVLKASVLIKKKGKTVSYVILASSHRLGNPSGPVREEILVQFMWKKAVLLWSPVRSVLMEISVCATPRVVPVRQASVYMKKGCPSCLPGLPYLPRRDNSSTRVVSTPKLCVIHINGCLYFTTTQGKVGKVNSPRGPQWVLILTETKTPIYQSIKGLFEATTILHDKVHGFVTK